MYWKEYCTIQFSKMLRMVAFTLDAQPDTFDHRNCNLTKNYSIINVSRSIENLLATLLSYTMFFM